MAPTDEQPPRSKVEFSGQIPQEYAPKPCTNLLGRKWWTEMLAKDALWSDIANNIPSTILNRRLKVGPVTIVTDIEQKAEMRAQKRRQRETGRRNGEPSEAPSVNTTENSTTATDESRETAETTVPEPVEGGAVRENEAIAPEPVPSTQTSNERIEKMECAKCDELVSLSDLRPDSNGHNACLHCKDSHLWDTGSYPLTIKQESENESDADIFITQLTKYAQRTLAPVVKKEDSDTFIIHDGYDSGLEVVDSHKRKRGCWLRKDERNRITAKKQRIKVEVSSDSD